jgi:AraC family transcriptional regulator
MAEFELRHADIGGFLLNEYSYPADSVIELASSDHPSLNFVSSGSFSDDYRHDQRICPSQTLLFLPAHQTGVRKTHGNGATWLQIELRPSALEFMGVSLSFLQRPTSFEGGELGVLAHRIHKEFRLMDDQSPLAIKGLLLELLSRASRLEAAKRGPRAPACLARAQSILRANYGDAIRLPALAAEVGVHQVYLARVFRKHLRCSIGEYLRRLRIEYAVDALADSTLSLAEIALRAGFADQSHFTRVFRTQTGITPAKYRNARISANPDPAS